LIVCDRRQLLPQDGNSLGRLDPEAHLVALDSYDRDEDIRTYHDLLQRLAAQDQHPVLPATANVSSSTSGFPTHDHPQYSRSRGCSGDIAVRSFALD
jgi:hypothetical protein